MYRSPFAVGLCVVVLLIIGAGLAIWQFVSIKSTGTPLGPAFRTPDHIVQIISTQERFLPRLHRSPAKDRFRLDLLVVPLADPARAETIPLVRQQAHNVLLPMTKIIGVDGDTVWVQAMGLFAVNLKSKRVTELRDLQRAIPELNDFLAIAKFHFSDQLIAVSPDRERAFAIHAETLRAEPCDVPQSMGGIHSEPNANDVMCSGGILRSNEWIAAITPKEAGGSFKPGFSLPRDFALTTAKETRQIFGGRFQTNDVRPRIESVARVSDTEYRNGAFLRSAHDSGLMQLADPDSVLLVYRTSFLKEGRTIVARWKTDHSFVWSADTGIDFLKQILPGKEMVVFIGERPPEPSKVPEPILVIVDVATGQTQTVSLWR